MRQVLHRSLLPALLLSFSALLTPAPAAEPPGSDPLTREIGSVIRERLDAYRRGDAVAWARHVAPDCLCGPLTPAELQKEITARLPSLRIWYGEIEELQVRSYGEAVVARYRATEHSEVGGQRLAFTGWRTETFVRRGSSWVLVALSDAPIPADPPIARVDPRILNSLVGRYAYGDGLVDTVTREADHLAVQATGQPKEEIFPESETTFFAKGQDWRLLFDRDAEGRVTGLRFRQGGHDLVAVRMKDAGTTNLEGIQ